VNNITKNIDFKIVKMDDKNRPGYITGWASTPKLDTAGEIIDIGAFSDSITRRGLKGAKGVKFLLNHKSTQIAGRLEVLEYRGERLWIEAQFALDVSYVADFYKVMKMNDGMSFSVGFRNGQYRQDEDGQIHIYKADLMEVSVVPFPANEDCEVVSIREDKTMTTAEDTEQNAPKEIKPATEAEKTPAPEADKAPAQPEAAPAEEICEECQLEKAAGDSAQPTAPVKATEKGDSAAEEKNPKEAGEEGGKEAEEKTNAPAEPKQGTDGEGEGKGAEAAQPVEPASEEAGAAEKGGAKSAGNIIPFKVEDNLAKLSLAEKQANEKIASLKLSLVEQEKRVADGANSIKAIEDKIQETLKAQDQIAEDYAVIEGNSQRLQQQLAEATESEDLLKSILAAIQKTKALREQFAAAEQDRLEKMTECDAARADLTAKKQELEGATVALQATEQEIKSLKEEIAAATTSLERERLRAEIKKASSSINKVLGEVKMVHTSSEGVVRAAQRKAVEGVLEVAKEARANIAFAQLARVARKMRNAGE